MKIRDGVTLAVIQNGLQQVCDEMDIAFQRAAFSPVISETLDRSDGIYHRDTGELVAQGGRGMPIFVGCMQFSTQAVIEYIRCKKMEAKPGDVFMVNDPYMGGTHVMDVKLVRPFYYRGKLLFWLSNTGHWPDFGGMVPGGFSASATEIEQEGLRLPPVKIVKSDVMDEEILSIVLSNIRIAEERIGDMRAQLGALKVGDKRLTELLDRYGRDVVEECIVEFRARSARQMRAKIATIPDGTYKGESFLDSDGIVNEPLHIRMTIRKEGTELYFDLSRSSAPCLGPMNSVLATTKSAIFLAMKHIFPDVPINAGIFDPLHIEDPVGTFLHAEYPRPVAGCAAEVSQRVCEAVFNTLVNAIPSKVWAAPAGTVGNLTVGGFDPVRNQRYVMYVVSGGGYGGCEKFDGLSNGSSCIGYAKVIPVEVLEQYYPVTFDHYQLRNGSAGPGRHRGGLGIRYKFTLTRGEGTLSFICDHGRFGPPGALGGKAGGVNRVVVHRADGSQWHPPHLSKDQGIVLRAGDAVEVFTPGGGGFGEPGDRDREAIARDVFLEYCTLEEARRDYA